jgi:hypothetical protein
MRHVVSISLLLVLLSSVTLGQDAYGISSAYLDMHTKQMIYDFSMYQPVKRDSTLLFEWSSYTYYMAREVMSKQWANYWLTKHLAIGTEIELWYTWNKDYQSTEWKLNKLYIIPRLGIQVRFW